MKELEFYIPKLEELWFYQKMMQDPDTMSYNAGWDVTYKGYHKDTGVIDFPREEWEDWYNDWIGQEPERFFAYIKRCSDGEWIGNINFHHNRKEDWWDMGIVIYAPYRGKGYSNIALKMLMEHAFKDCGVTVLHNDFEPTRVAARKAHLKAGFKEIGVENGICFLQITRDEYLSEYIDIFSRDGSIIKESVPKHTPRLPGEYIQHVLVIMKTADSPAPGKGEGQYVVQQRSLKAKYYAGKWDMTGGGVKSGESPKEAACREVEEELSITVPPENMELAFEYIKEWDDGTGLLASIFMCRVEVPEDGFKFNTYEVNDVKVMPFNEFLEHVKDHNDEEFCKGLEDIEKRL